MAKIKEEFRIIPAYEIRYITEKGTDCVLQKNLTQKGIIVLKIKPGKAREIVEFIAKFVKKTDWRKRLLTVAIEVFYKRRTLDQNSLYWALLTILSFVAYGCYGFEEEIHEGILQMYAPKEEEKATGMLIAKRSKNLNTVEFAEIIQGAFHEISAQGVPVSSVPDIKRYYEEFYKWRWQDGEDVLKFKTLEVYRERVNYCEACMKYLDYNAQTHRYEDTPGNICHIVTAGSGGSDSPEDVLHLCDKCHIEIQHTQGWEKFLELYPHLIPKVKRSRDKQGRKQITADQDLKLLPEPEQDQEAEQQLEIF